MQTECPHCHTLFRLTEAQLDIAGGQVRCGYCNAVFNALRTNELIDNDRQLDVFEDTPAVNFDGSENVDHQEAGAPGNTTTGPIHAEADAPVREHEAGGLFEQELNDVVPEQFRTDGSGEHSTWSTLLWSIAILLLIASLITEYAWFNRDQLLNQPQLQPHIAGVCEHIRCDGYISLRDPESIEMLRRNVYTHPNEKNALMISATLINHASFAQAMPDVQIDFSSTRGKVVASRRFKPAEYLQLDHNEARLMQPGQPVSFRLEIADPGTDAITYEFMFL